VPLADGHKRSCSSIAVQADEGHQENQAEAGNLHDKEEEHRPIPEVVGPDVKAAGLLDLATCFPLIVDRDRKQDPELERGQQRPQPGSRPRRRLARCPEVRGRRRW
jgi:hypothetical protein